MQEIETIVKDKKFRIAQKSNTSCSYFLYIQSFHRNKEKNEIRTEYDRQFTICLHLWINENCKLETE